jgi:hypothetical protein
MSKDDRREGMSRRGLLTGAGVAASAGILSGVGRESAQAADGRLLPPGAPANSRLVGRIFPQLPPFAQPSDAVRAALLVVGAQGGP